MFAVLLLLLANIRYSFSSCTVTVPLIDRVVFLNKSISFSCSFDWNNDIDDIQLFLDESKLVRLTDEARGNYKDIYYERKDNGYTMTLNVSTLEYNDTHFKCILYLNDMDNCPTEGYLYVATGIILLLCIENFMILYSTCTFICTDLPPPPQSVMIGSVSPNFLMITWSPAWSYPVRNYTVLLSGDGGVTNEVNTSDTSIVISRNDIMYNDSTSECASFNITVAAITDIGASTLSHTVLSGFPICKFVFFVIILIKIIVLFLFHSSSFPFTFSLPFPPSLFLSSLLSTHSS